MVKSETRRDAEILVRNPSPRPFGKKFRDSKKGKNKPCKNETSRLIKNASEISRSCQHFPIPMFFEVPFTTPYVLYWTSFSPTTPVLFLWHLTSSELLTPYPSNKSYQQWWRSYLILTENKSLNTKRKPISPLGNRPWKKLSHKLSIFSRLKPHKIPQCKVKRIADFGKSFESGIREISRCRLPESRVLETAKAQSRNP